MLPVVVGGMGVGVADVLGRQDRCCRLRQAVMAGERQQRVGEDGKKRQERS